MTAPAVPDPSGSTNDRGESPGSGWPQKPTGRRNAAIVGTIVVIVAMVWSISGLDVSWERLRGAPGDGWDVVSRMFPPDFGTVIERGALRGGIHVPGLVRRLPLEAQTPAYR